MTKAVGIIPARWGSTRFPGKPLCIIAGKPLLQHVWERCSRATTLDSVIVATDHMRIAEAAFDWGAEVALTSPNHRSGTDRIAEVAAHAKGFGFIVNIQGDEPLIDPQLINRLVRKLQSSAKIRMVTAAHPFRNPREALSPHQVKVVVDRAGRALYFSRAPIPYPRSGVPRYFRHQGIYGLQRDLLLEFVKWKPGSLEQTESLEQLRALENGVTVHVLVTRHGSPGVDTPQDVKSIAAVLCRTRRKRGEIHQRRVAPIATTSGGRRR
jgi:3-deoxy-manno-octulosonate cytidylyltransferase (CMP-KDO synthetase)